MDANDARLVILELTDTGREAAVAMKDIAAEVSRQTLEPLSEGRAGIVLATASADGDERDER